MNKMKKLNIAILVVLIMTLIALISLIVLVVNIDNKKESNAIKKEDYNAVIVRRDESGNLKYIYDTEKYETMEKQDISIDAIMKKCTDDNIAFYVEMVTSTDSNSIGGPCTSSNGSQIPHILKVRDKTKNCNDGEVKEIYCTECNKVLGSKKVGNIAHHWGDWYFLGQSTCEGGGTRERECELCGEKQTQTERQFKHEYGPYKTDDTSRCTEGTKLTRQCKYCGAVDTQQFGPKGHMNTHWDIIIVPTETSAGAGVRMCDDCGAVLEQSLILYEDLSKYINNEIPYIQPEEESATEPTQSTPEHNGTAGTVGFEIHNTYEAQYNTRTE